MDLFSVDQMHVTEPRAAGIDVQEHDSMIRGRQVWRPRRASASCHGSNPGLLRDSATGFPGATPSSGKRATNADRGVRYASPAHDVMATAKTDVDWSPRERCQVRVP